MELEDAIKQCMKFIKSFKEDDTKSVIGFDVKAIETVLQALEKLQNHCKEMIKEKQELSSALLDSIPKKKIEDKIKKLDSKKEEDRVIKIYTPNKKYYYETDKYNDIIKQVLQELLEE